MMQEQMSLAEVYRSRELVEQDDIKLWYFTANGQSYVFHLVAPQEIQCGINYPVLIEHHNGQLLRKHLSGAETVYIGRTVC